MENEAHKCPEAPLYMLTISETIVRYAKGYISTQEYSEMLNAWWDRNKEAWKESDLGQLFYLTCFFK